MLIGPCGRDLHEELLIQHLAANKVLHRNVVHRVPAAQQQGAFESLRTALACWAHHTRAEDHWHRGLLRVDALDHHEKTSQVRVTPWTASRQGVGDPPPDWSCDTPAGGNPLRRARQ